MEFACAAVEGLTVLVLACESAQISVSSFCHRGKSLVGKKSCGPFGKAEWAGLLRLAWGCIGLRAVSHAVPRDSGV